MKKLLLPILVIILSTFSFSQEVKKDDWIRVQSDDGEFSIEIPSKYGFFSDKSGTMISDNSGDYELSEMNILNVYVENTLFSFETYKAKKKALELIIDSNESNAKWQKASVSKSEIKKAGFKIKQQISKNDIHFTVRQYFYSKNYIYVLTGSSRIGETATMKRFFESLVFNPDSKSPVSLKESRFPNLNLTPIKYEEQFEIAKKDDKPTTPKKTNPSIDTTKLQIISQPAPSFTQSARINNEQGTVRIRVTFTEFGQITKIVGIRSLNFGLYRNAVFAALRMKYLPQETDKIPVTVSKIIEYRFSFY
jgi:hypothetical protein